MKSLRKSRRAYGRGVVAAAAIVASASSVLHAQQFPVFDNLTPFENNSTLPGDAGIYYTFPEATDNPITTTQYGDAYVVPAGTPNLTGIDYLVGNYTSDPSLSAYPWYNGGAGTTYNAIKIVVSVWGTVTPTTALNMSNPALSPTNPAFSNLLGTATLIDNESGANGIPFAPGVFADYEGDGATLPGLPFPKPIPLNGATTIGVSVDIEGSTDGGNTFNFNSGLTSFVAGDATPTVGQQQLTSAWYLNSNGETNGNFTEDPYYYPDVNGSQGVATRLFSGYPIVFNWISSGGGNFTTGNNYSPVGPPSTIDSVLFNLSSPSPYTVTVLTYVQVSTISILNDNVIFDFPSFNSQTFFGNALTVGQSLTAGGTTHGTLALTNSTLNTEVLVEAGNFVIGGNGGTGTLTIGQDIYAYSDADTSIAAGSKIVVQQGGSLRTGTLTFAGSTNAWLGQLDIGSSDMIVRNGSIGTIINQIKSGYTKGAWTGQGIISSVAAADSTHLTAVGAIVNNNGSGGQIYGNSSTGTLGLFGGDNPNVNAVLIKYTYYGDANLDGKVDGSDYSLIDNGFASHLTGWYNGDFNYDGVVDGSDYTLIDNAFNNQSSVSGVGPLARIGNSSGQLEEHLWSPTRSTLFTDTAKQAPDADPSASTTAQIAVTAVPEPASIGMLAAGTIAALARRSKRRAR